LIFDCIIHVLRDGEPHDFSDFFDTYKSTAFNDRQLQLALDFLKTYGFVQHRHNGSWQLTVPVVNFLKELKELEG